MSTYVVSGERLALRLEPIINLKDNQVIGYEALSRFVKKDRVYDYEAYFLNLSSCTLIGIINRQLEIYQKWHSQHPEIYGDKVLFINIRTDLLEDNFFVSTFLPFSKLFKIAIEIDASACGLNDVMKDRIGELTGLGISVWVDDYAGDVSINHQKWDGIKVDKFAFWSSFDSDSNILSDLDVDKILNRYDNSQYRKPTLLVEGIESEAHLHHAIESGFELGQGYYWKSLGLVCN